MKPQLIAVVIVSALGLAAAPAHAKGCVRGAVAGGVAGHYAGHHGVMGAAAGCVAGRAYYKHQARAATQQPASTRR